MPHVRCAASEIPHTVVRASKHLQKSLLVSLCACLWLVGCKNAPTWSAESKSPDQKMIAKAETVDNGGFGTGFTQTAVFLNWANGSQKPKLILSFSGGPNVPGGMNVGINWISNAHLELVYNGARPIDFEAVRCDGIDITVRNSAAGAADSLQ